MIVYFTLKKSTDIQMHTTLRPRIQMHLGTALLKRIAITQADIISGLDWNTGMTFELHKHPNPLANLQPLDLISMCRHLFQGLYSLC